MRDAPAGLLAGTLPVAGTGRSLLDEALGETVAREAALDHAQAQAHAADGGGVVDDVAAARVVAHGVEAGDGHEVAVRDAAVKSVSRPVVMHRPV